ncbi:hypothetical protein HZC30_03055 [Candidatus Woesearchaeota archaeon]|nr:hypothetical protein [Candidatus Woesearchaeota archaeon]
MGRTEAEKEKLEKEALVAKKRLNEAKERDLYDHRNISLSLGYCKEGRYIPNKDISGKFLTETEVLALRKDHCIFCNTELDTIETVSINTHAWIDDNMNTGSSERLVIKYVVAEDSYYFNVDFSEGLAQSILSHRNRLEKELVKQKNRELKQLLQEWSSLPLPRKQKAVAVEALSQDWCNENLGESHFGRCYKLSHLVDNAVYHLYLGDLNSVCARDSKTIPSEGRSFPYYFDWYEFKFSPQGLKSHQKCWPFEIPTQDTRIKTTYGEFLACLKKNPLFVKYDSQFPQFKTAWKCASTQTLEIIANSYTLADGVKMGG